MFAVIKLGGLQHVVKIGDVLKVNKIDTSPDTELVINEVLARGDNNNVEFGTPYLSGATVTARVLDHTKDAKVIIFKKKRRHNYRKKVGHRQSITQLEITNIQ